MTRDKTRARCDIAMLVDAEVGEPDDTGSFILERGVMEWHVMQMLQREEHCVCIVPFDSKITPTIEKLRSLKPRLVFNLTEWVAGDRRLDSAIAGVLEMMNLRYTGTGPEGMQIARDKALAKQVVADLGIAVAPHVIANGHRVAFDSLTFPVIVKPQFGDGSDEIDNASFVRTGRGLERRIAMLRKRRHDPLMCEQFVAGRDLFVALLGNKPQVMRPLELVVGRKGAGAPRLATGRVKNNRAYLARWRIRYREPELPADVSDRITDASRRIFAALKLRDYGRIDYRLTPENELVFLEANPNPDLARHTFGRNRCFAGVAYPELIATIVRSALRRPR